METTFTVVVEKGAGTLSRVIAAVSRLDLRFKKHYMADDSNAERKRLTIVASGDGVPDGELTAALKATNGVVDVLEIQSGDSAGAAPAGKASASGGSDDAGIRQMVNELIDSYPEIYNQVQEFQDKVKPKVREATVKKLGDAVGRGVVKAYPDLSAISTLEDAATNVVLPALLPIAPSQFDGEAILIRLSPFTKRHINNMDLVFGMEADRCFFLTGFIQGLLNGIGVLPKMQVVETSCKSNGERQCRFYIKQA